MRGAFCVLSMFAVGAVFGQQPNRFDVLITGARVIDGSGSPWYYADVGILGDTIAAVGPLPQRKRDNPH
jgi:N-acyl-D-aspartate/D-glutamate deacylase